MDATGKLSLVIVTPQGEKLAGAADEICAPGFKGEFGVLPSHIEFFTKCPPGVFSAGEGGRTTHWALGKGFIEVSHDRVLLTVQSAEKADDIDVERAQRAKRRAEEELAKLEGAVADPKWEEFSLRLARAEARLAAAAKK